MKERKILEALKKAWIDDLIVLEGMVFMVEGVVYYHITDSSWVNLLLGDGETVIEVTEKEIRLWIEIAIEGACADLRVSYEGENFIRKKHSSASVCSANGKREVLYAVFLAPSGKQIAIEDWGQDGGTFIYLSNKIIPLNLIRFIKRKQEE